MQLIHAKTKRKQSTPDDILTPEDRAAIRAAEKAKKEGKLVTYEQLKKELGARCT